MKQFYYNVVSDSNSDEEKKEEKNVFEPEIDDEFELIIESTLNSKVVRVMKNL